MRKEILVTGYVNPDLDSVACAYSYAHLLNETGKKAVGTVFGKHHQEADHVIKEYGLNLDITEYNPEDFTEVVLVDTCDIAAIDKRIDPLKVIEIIDHHKINESEQFPNARVQIEMVGAAATLIVEKFIEKKVILPKELATLLYGAIISNTLNLNASVTTDRDREAANYLKSQYGFQDDFAHKMFLSKSDFSGEKLTQMVRGDFNNYKSYNFGGKKLGIAQIEMIDGKNLADTRGEEVAMELRQIAEELGLDTVFMSIVDIEANQNIFICPSDQTKKLLEKILKVKFEEDIAVRPGLLMRKEIIPLIKERFEK